MTYFDKVIAASNTQVMLHDPIQFLKVEHSQDFDSNKKLYENLRSIAINRYSQKMGMDKEKVSEMMKATTWLSAKEAKAKGLVDEVVIKNEKLRTELASSAELIKNELQVEMNAKSKNDNDMKEILKTLGLSEGTGEEQVINAVNTLKSSAVKAVVELAKIKGLKTESIIKLAEGDIDNTLKMIMETKPVNETLAVNTVVQTIENNLKGRKIAEEKIFDDYTPFELEIMAEKEPEKYEQLIKNTYK